MNTLKTPDHLFSLLPNPKTENWKYTNIRKFLPKELAINDKKKVDLKHSTVWNNYIFKIKKTNCLDGFDLDKNSIYLKEEIFKKGLFLRNWKTGDVYRDKNNKKKRVSKLFLKNKFNNYKKMVYPLLVDASDRILWIPGLLDGFGYDDFSKNNCIKISKEILN